MHICICNALSDRRIRQEIAAGARSAGEIYGRCGVVPQCGKCVPHVREMVRGGQAEAAPATLAALAAE